MKNDERRMKNFIVRRILILSVLLLTVSASIFADDRHGRIQIGAGLLYERGMDLTIGYE